MGDVVSGLKEVSAAVAQSQRAGAAATPTQQQAGAAADAEAAWRQTGDGAKWLECLDDADVAGGGEGGRWVDMGCMSGGMFSGWAAHGPHMGCGHRCLLQVHALGWMEGLQLCSPHGHVFACSPNHTATHCSQLIMPPRPSDCPVAERRVSDALALLRRLEKLLQRFVAAADAADPSQQVRGGAVQYGLGRVEAGEV